MGVGAGLYMYDVVVKKFKFAISSPDEFLFLMPKISAKLKRGYPQRRRQMQVAWVKCRCGSCKLATFYAKRCQFNSVASL